MILGLLSATTKRKADRPTAPSLQRRADRSNDREENSGQEVIFFLVLLSHFLLALPLKGRAQNRTNCICGSGEESNCPQHNSWSCGQVLLSSLWSTFLLLEPHEREKEGASGEADHRTVPQESPLLSSAGASSPIPLTDEREIPVEEPIRGSSGTVPWALLGRRRPITAVSPWPRNPYYGEDSWVEKCQEIPNNGWISCS